MSLATRRRFLGIAGAALAAPAVARSGFAQAWPAKPIRAMVPFAAGSTIDVVTRILFEPLAQRLGQPIVIENRGGAGGSIGAAIAARYEPDGYNLLINASAHTNAPAAYPKITYDPARDFHAVISFGSIPNVVVTAPSKGFRTLKDLVEAGKKAQLTYGSAGIGSATHWAVERLRLSAGFEPLHVPFKVGPDATMSTVAGRVDFMAPGLSGARQPVLDKRLIALAVSTPRRSFVFPDVPTTLEAGYPDSDYTFWNGMFVPAKTSREIIDRLHHETGEALKHPMVQEKYRALGIESMPMTPQEFDALVVREIAINHALVKAAGLKFD
jgi:tripartite-type tricarboxylate transporter receptor subunit TctC